MSGKRILFVEDEAPLLELLGEALADAGFDVATARHGAEALPMLGVGATFDAIISDVSMPGGVSGIDLGRRAQELHPQIHVILVSGLSKAQLPALPEGVTFLPKPYRMGDLISVLERGADVSA